jgi:DUF1365 family protein
VGGGTMTDSALYICWVMHRRPGPPRYRFSYRSFYLLLDLDRLDSACASTPLLSHNRFNLLSFYDADHGFHDGVSLRVWVESLLRERGAELAGGRIRLLTIPRVLGYGFNPISVFYCERARGELVAIVAEVHNTFGEHHCYVLDNGGDRMDWQAPRTKSKRFHVSPFLERRGVYQFRIGRPAERLGIGIRLFDGEDEKAPLRIATALTGRCAEINSRNVLKVCLHMPLLPMKVMAAIYWQAFKLWLRRTPWFSKPRAQHPPVS